MNEVDDGSPFVLIEKVLNRVRRLEEELEKVKARLYRSERNNKEGRGVVEQVRTQLSSVSKAAKVKKAGKIVGSVTKMPMYHEWVEYIQQSYSPIDGNELARTYQAGNMLQTKDIRQHLAIRFGAQMSDHKFLSPHDITALVKAAGFNVVSRREFFHLETKRLTPYSSIAMCVKK
jgi:hypothetical protein